MGLFLCRRFGETTIPEPENTPPDDEPARERVTLDTLDRRLAAFDASRKRIGAGPFGVGQAASDGYRLLGQMLGGVLGGLGIGWLIDHVTHTSPWGVVGGLVIGATLSIIATVKTASAISARSVARDGVAPAASADDDD